MLQITNEAYVLAGCVLASSLRRVGTTVPVVAVITDRLARDHESMARLAVAGFDYAVLVDRIGNPAHDAMARHELVPKPDKIQAHKADVFTKLRIFALTEFDRVLFIDADCVVTRNVDHLLQRDVSFSFAPSLQPLAKCKKDASQEKYIFRYKEREWCQSHSKNPYHGTMDLRNHNAGVMLLRPHADTFRALLALMHAELQHKDSCIGVSARRLPDATTH